MKTDQTAGQRRGLRLTAVCAAMAAAFALPGTATAFEINTGNEDIQMRWDNTVRLNIVERVAGQQLGRGGEVAFRDRGGALRHLAGPPRRCRRRVTPDRLD